MTTTTSPPDSQVSESLADREKKALVAIRKLRARLQEVEYKQHEPIAIVGLSCRFPKAPDADSYWRLLDAGTDAIREVPADRWDIDAYYDPDPDAPGKVYTRRAGYIDNIEGFDAAFFGISPREAEFMDPQQRILLEQAWHALEYAGIAPRSLHGSRTGVFVGITACDYAMMIQEAGIDIGPYYVTGNPLNVAAGRLAYVLRLHGPAMAIDTACSSSLVAVHQACQSLRSGESDLALAAGVNLLISPQSTIATCRAHMMSPDGWCKTFDEAADGYVRGEGCGVVVLKRLSDAQRNRDRILTVIRGSAVNQDGHSSGLTVPNGPAQQRVITEALRVAGLTASDVQYVEAHGTGTPLGDPIELQAVSAALGADRDVDSPLLVGSVKTNIGHLESAAGIAGLIKVVLALQHGRVPGQLHLHRPNPLIPWDELNLRVPTRSEPWPIQGQRRIAGVSAFGFSGTNSHVVVEGPVEESNQASDAQQPASPGHRLLTLSARTSEALRQLAGEFQHSIEGSDEDGLADVCYTANVGRNHFEQRAALVFGSADQLLSQLQALGSGDGAPGLHVGELGQANARPKIGFLFTGQGAQYTGMGRELYDTESVYRDHFDRCAAEFERLGGHEDGPGLLELVFEAQHQGLLTQTRYVQPVLYALQVSLAALWDSWGVTPHVLLGHSAGEYAAACVAGVIGIEDGLRLVVERARLMQELPAGGAMLSVSASADVVETALAGDDSVCVSAYHGLNTVISGSAERLDALMAQFEEQELNCHKLPASNAFHSMYVDPMLDAFESFAGGFEYAPPSRRLVSSMTGSTVDRLDASYWRNHARQPVRFAEAVRTLFETVGCDAVVELGPQAELMWLARMCWRPRHKVLWTSSLAKGQDAHAQMLSAAAQLHVHGTTLDFAGIEGDALQRRRRVTVPLYPFQRERHWVEFPDSPRARPAWSGQTLEDCVYRIVWERRATGSDPQPSASANWLLVCDEAGMGAAVARQLQQLGHRCVCLDAGTCAELTADSLAERIGEAEVDGPFQYVVHLGSLDTIEVGSVADLQRAQTCGVESVLRLVQALLKRSWKGRLWLLTRGVQHVVEADTVQPAHSPIWGMGKVIGLEQPALWGGLLDLPMSVDTTALAAEVVAACSADDPEDQVALRDGGRWVARLVEDQALRSAHLHLEADATYLITGGLGDIGMSAARRLAQRGARHLVLSSRKPPSEAAEAAIARLGEQGCEVTVLLADVSREDELLGLFDDMQQRGLPRLAGVIHAAGVPSTVPLEQMDRDELYGTISAKVFGAWLLDRIISERGMELAFFVCTSSIAAVWGSATQASYAAGNAFLDALCERRRLQGRAATAVSYGPWQQTGSGMSTEEVLELLAPRGIHSVSPEQALNGMEALVAAGVTGRAIARMDWSKFRVLAEAARPRPLLEHLGQAPAHDQDAPVEEPASSALRRLRETPEPERFEAVAALVRKEFAAVLKLPSERLTDDVSFFSLGIDSLMAVEATDRLDRQLAGIGVTVQLVFEHPSIRQLATELAPRIGSMDTGAVAEAPAKPVLAESTLSRLEWPASISQKRIWFLQQWAPASPQFNLPTAIRFRKGIELGLLQRILSELLRRHDSLCTTLREVDGEVLQVVQRRMVPLLAMFDLSTSEDPETRLRELMTSEARKGFDLANSPMIRVSLVTLKASEQVLLVTMHHAISDGTSNRVLIEEFLALYEAFARGEPSPLPEPEVQFWSYAADERARLERPETQGDEDYWREELSHIPSLDLSCDRVRPAVQTHRGEHLRVCLSSDLRDELHRFSREAGVTPFETLLATWALLLGRYSGQDDFGVGTPVAGRPGSQWRNVIGLFLNMLTLRIRMQKTWTVRELLAHVHDVAARAYAHQSLPFDWLVHRVNPVRDPSRAPIFQTALILQVTKQDLKDRMDQVGVEVEDLRPHLGASQYDITLDLEETSGGIQGFLEYNADLFDRWRVEQMAEHFETLLDSLLKGLDRSLDELQLLNASERHRLLCDWNQSVRDFPTERCVHELVAEQARRNPKKVAVICGEQRLSYADLNRRANQLAHHLRARGVGAETLVGLCVDRSVDMVVAMLGVMKAGGAYVPLDPYFPKRRLEQMLEDSRVTVLLSQAALLDQLPETQATVVCVDRDRDRIAREPDREPEQIAKSDSTVYVIYTSGSTGRPKGVVVTHGNLLNFLMSMAEETGFTAAETLVAVTTLSFDISNLEILLPLVQGACTVVATRAATRDAQLLQQLLRDNSATIMQATPATWRMLLASSWRNPEQIRVLCGGEALPRDLAEQLLDVTGTLWNVYGPTETTIWSTIHRVREVPGSTAHLGHPLANTQLYILDDHFQPVPVGVPGELFIGGSGVARGYLNQPELTAERFIPDPFAPRPGARLYRTGDLCQRLADGSIEFLGRSDQQVKVRGFRIELGDIEAAMAACPGVRQAAVTAWKGADGFDALAGYLVADKESRPEIAEVKAVLRESLPEYMVPNLFMYLDELPLTPNNKIDRRALPSPDTVRDVARKEFVAPRTETERALAEIWQAVLGVERVGIGDDFFDLGGHSLLLVQILATLKERLKVELSIVDLYQHATVAALAEHLERRSDTAAPAITNEAEGVPASDPSTVDLEPNADASSFSVANREIHHQLDAGPPYTYRRYRAGDKGPAIASLRESFGHAFARNAERTFDWKYLQNPRNPADGPIVDILECDGQIVGMNGRIPVAFKLNEDERAGVWNGDTHVVPEHRKVSGWFAYQANQIAPEVSLGMPNPHNYAIISAANAVIDIARFTELKVCLDIGPVLETKGFNPVLSSICGLAFAPVPRTLDSIARFRIESGISVRKIVDFDDTRFDDLWCRVSDGYAGIMVRDRAFLSWRFDDCPNRSYTRYVAERDGQVVGYMVTREFPWGGVGRGRIVDYLVGKKDLAVLNSLLRSALHDFRVRGVVSAICSVFTTETDQLRELRRPGFFHSRPGPV
ncbi:MAG: amino acid adenylation domain-containing protein, partial [Gammaproteobacteria bacterium]|nr:amino acid adenylation domain-containing protein [Gammaproteobacteria bacterium]